MGKDEKQEQVQRLREYIKKEFPIGQNGSVLVGLESGPISFIYAEGNRMGFASTFKQILEQNEELREMLLIILAGYLVLDAERKDRILFTNSLDVASKHAFSKKEKEEKPEVNVKVVELDRDLQEKLAKVMEEVIAAEKGEIEKDKIKPSEN